MPRPLKRLSALRPCISCAHICVACSRTRSTLTVLRLPNASGEAVSWFSRLRTLDEFQRYLRRLDVGAQDCRLSEKALKRLQSVLGKYTGRAQFVSLAKELNLSCQNKIKKDRRLSRKRARRAVLKLKSAQAHPLLPIRRSLMSV